MSAPHNHAGGPYGTTTMNCTCGDPDGPHPDFRFDEPLDRNDVLDQLTEETERLGLYADKKNESIPEFLQDMQQELIRAEKLHPPYNSYHEAYAVILEELDEFWDIVRMKTEARNPKDARDELIQIAVTAWRTSRDLKLNDE